MFLFRLAAIVASVSLPIGGAPAAAGKFPSTANGKFVGGILGVSAKVNLCVRNQVAAVELSGLPLGGTLAGTARFQDGEGSPVVVVDEPLRSQLRRRFVRIVSARFDEKQDRVYVTVRLPLLLGTQTIPLGRAPGEGAVHAAFEDLFDPLLGCYGSF
jgi:hypothetical protein